MNLKKFALKIAHVYYFDDIIENEDFDFGNIFLDEKSYKNILVYDMSCKTLRGAKPVHVMFNKVERFFRVYDGTRYLVLFGPKNMLFTIGLDIL